MVNLLLLAAAAATGVPMAWVIVAALAVWRPWWFLLASAGWGLLARFRSAASDDPAAEAVFLAAVAAELRAGASLRHGLVAAAERSPDLVPRPVLRRAAAGRPLEEVAIVLRGALRHNGRLVAAAVRISGATGAGASGAFAALAMRATEAAEAARERRALTAQARLSAVIVGAVPVAFTLVLLVARPDAFTAAGSAGIVMAGVGVVLEVAGLAAVGVMIRRAEAW